MKIEEIEKPTIIEMSPEIFADWCKLIKRTGNDFKKRKRNILKKKRLCPKCEGTGIVSHKYMKIGKQGNSYVYSYYYCDCPKGRKMVVK